MKSNTSTDTWCASDKGFGLLRVYHYERLWSRSKGSMETRTGFNLGATIDEPWWLKRNSTQDCTLHSTTVLLSQPASNAHLPWPQTLYDGLFTHMLLRSSPK